MNARVVRLGVQCNFVINHFSLKAVFPNHFIVVTFFCCTAYSLFLADLFVCSTAIVQCSFIYVGD